MELRNRRLMGEQADLIHSLAVSQSDNKHINKMIKQLKEQSR